MVGEYRVRTRVPLVAAAGTAGVALGVMAYAVEEPAGLALMLASLGVTFVALLVVTMVTLTPPMRRRRGRVSVEDGRLVIDGVVTMRRISGSAVVERGALRDVHLFDGSRAPRFVLLSLSLDESADVAAAVDGASGDERFEFSLGTFKHSPGRAWLAIGGLALTFGLSTLGGHPEAMLALPLFLVPMALPVTATVGRDGIAVRGLLAKDYLAFADVLSVVAEGEMLRVTPRSGKTFRIGFGANRQSLDALVGRIDALRAAALGAPAFEELLGRGEREDAAWAASLKRLATPDYRQTALDDERLWQVLENVNCSQSARAAAALLLRGRMAEPDLVRLRVLAEATVSPELRRVLDSVSESSDPMAGEELPRTLAGI